MDNTQQANRLAKIIVQIIAGLFFWPGVIWMGVEYGWKLPVAIMLMLIGIFVNMATKKL